MSFNPDELKRELNRIQKELNAEAGAAPNTQIPMILAGIALLIAAVALIVALVRPGAAPTEVNVPTAVAVVATEATEAATAEATADVLPSEELLTQQVSQVSIDASSTDPATDPLQWTFTAVSESEMLPLTYKWEFGDGSEGEGEGNRITHTYTRSGDYTVKLTLVNDADEPVGDAILEPIIVLPRLSAVIVPAQGDNQPLEWTFTANVEPVNEAKTLSYEWTITDASGTSVINWTEAAFPHAFQQAGSYTVTLSVSDPQSGRTTTDSVLIDVQEPLVAGFAFSPARYSLTVQFEDRSQGSPERFEWDFNGDGTPDSIEASPSHTFPDFDTYPVKLTVRRGSDEDDIDIDVTIDRPVDSQIRVQLTTNSTSNDTNVMASRPDATSCTPLSQQVDANPAANPDTTAGGSNNPANESGTGASPSEILAPITAEPCVDIFALSHDFITQRVLEVTYSITDGENNAIVDLPFDISFATGSGIESSVVVNGTPLQPVTDIANSGASRLQGKAQTDRNGEIRLQIGFIIPPNGEPLTDELTLLGEGFLTLETPLLPAANRWMRIQPTVPAEYGVLLGGSEERPLTKTVESVFRPGSSAPQTVTATLAYFRTRPEPGTQNNSGVVYFWVNKANLAPVDDPQTQDVDESTQPLTVGSLVTNTPPLNYCSSISCWPSENALASQPIPEPLEGRIIGRVTISDTSFVLVEYNVNYN